MHVERTFTVPRPIDEVFAYLGDFTATEEWDPGTVSTTRTSGTGGLRTTYANTSTFMGRNVELSYETITYQHPTKVQFRGHNGATTATDSMTFSPDPDGGTTIYYRADFTFGPFLRVLAPLVIGRKLDALADETVAQIKRCLG